MLILNLIIISTGLITIHADEFVYPSDSWGEMCKTGTSQSPINLDINEAEEMYSNELQFTNYKQNLRDSFIVNNKYTVKIKDFKKTMSFSGGPLTGSYIFEELHFHWSSEHTIQDERYPLEMHIVHRNEKYKDLSEALKNEDGVAVVGILYRISKENGNKAIEKLSKPINSISNKANTPVLIDDDILLDALLPKQMSSKYFWYNGSLTTPTCNEGVSWFVLQQTVGIWESQLNLFASIQGSDGKNLVSNYRSIQKINNRTIYFVRASAIKLKQFPELMIILSLSYFIDCNKFYL